MILEKFMQWRSGLSKVNEKISKLTEEKREIETKISDTVQDDPAKTIPMQTRLQQIPHELSVAEAVKSQYERNLPFSRSEFIGEFRATVAPLPRKLDEPIQKVVEARKAFLDALKAYDEAYGDYVNEYETIKRDWRGYWLELDKSPDASWLIDRDLGVPEWKRGELFNAPNLAEE